MRFIISISFLVFLSGCIQRKSNCVFTSDQLLEQHASQVFGTNITNKKISDFRDKGKDSIVGGYYSFYANGHLKSYQYFANLEAYVYSEEYDKNDELSKVEGVPLVHNTIILTGDSISIKMYFFSLNKKYTKINVVTHDKRILALPIIDDSLYSNIKVASFKYFNLKGNQDIVSYIDVEYQNICDNKSTGFRDTISLHYNGASGKVSD